MPHILVANNMTSKIKYINWTLSQYKISPTSSTEPKSSKRTSSYTSRLSTWISSLSRSSPSSCTARCFLRFLSASTFFFFSPREITVAILHTPTKPFSPGMTTWTSPRTYPPYTWSPHPLPPIPHNCINTFSGILSQVQPLIHSTKIPPPPNLMPLHLPGSHQPTINHYVSHHKFPEKTILWCMWTYQPYFRGLL